MQVLDFLFGLSPQMGSFGNLVSVRWLTSGAGTTQSQPSFKGYNGGFRSEMATRLLSMEKTCNRV
jgi:hypothetical protein